MLNNQSNQTQPSNRENILHSLESLSRKIFNQFSTNELRYQNDNDPDRFISDNMQIRNPDCTYHFPDEIEVHLSTKSHNHFNVAFHNINSLPSKLEDFTEVCSGLLINDIDVLGFCESKLTDSVQQLYALPNYQLYTNNVSRDMGGVAMYVNKKHNGATRFDLCQLLPHYESLFIELETKTKNIIIGVVYRRPHTNC